MFVIQMAYMLYKHQIAMHLMGIFHDFVNTKLSSYIYVIDTVNYNVFVKLTNKIYQKYGCSYFNCWNIAHEYQY